MEKRQLKLKTFLSTEAGFTLLEVMIAIAIFTVFAAVFVTGFGYNLVDSGKIKEDILLKDLCENKINDIIINPPTYAESLTLTKEIKDVEHYDNYQTIVEYRRFFVPDMSKIASKGSEEDEDSSDDGAQQAELEKKIYSVFKENMEKILWQVEVTVKNKTTGETFTLSTWPTDYNADVKIGSF